MKRKDKELAVEKLEKVFSQARMVVITRPQGLSVAEVSELRRRMRTAGARFQVAKNKLAKRAIANTNMKALGEHFTGPTAISWSDDMLAPTKVAVEFAKENEKLSVVVGATQENTISKENLQQLAQLPPIEVVRAKMLGLFQTPAQQLVRVLLEPSTALARVLKARAEQEP